MKKAIALILSLLLAVNLCAACAKADTNSTETSVESSQTKRGQAGPGGGTATGGGAVEHMTSFDYAYKIEAVRDWLFAQHS